MSLCESALASGVALGRWDSRIPTVDLDVTADDTDGLSRGEHVQKRRLTSTGRSH